MSAIELTCENARCADGRRLSRWIDERGVCLAPLGAAQRRALQRWRRGDQARLDTIERVLIPLGLTLHALPDNVWRPYDNGRRGVRSRARRG